MHNEHIFDNNVVDFISNDILLVSRGNHLHMSDPVRVRVHA